MAAWVNSANALIGRWGMTVLATQQLYSELSDDDFGLGDVLAMAAWGGTMATLWAPMIKQSAAGVIIANFAMPVVTGYAVGATAGTIIAQGMWGDRGAKMALGVYSNPRFEPGGITYETANILGNGLTIFTFYANRPPVNTPRHAHGYGWHWTDELREAGAFD